MTCTPQPQVCVCLLVPRRQLSSFVRLCAVHFLGGLAHRLRPVPHQPRCAIDICVVRREVSSLHTSLWSRRLLQSAASPSCFALWGVAPGRVTILLVYNEFRWSAMRDAALCVESVNCALCRVGQQKQIAPSQIGGEFGDRFFESKWDWGRLGPKRPDFVTVVDRSWFGGEILLSPVRCR